MPAGGGLTAPECLILLSLPRFDSRKAIKIGLSALLAQGILRLESDERPGPFRPRKAVRLHLASVPDKMPAVSASLVGVVRAAAPDGALRNVVKQAMREYRRTLTGFVLRVVAPELARRGLAEARRERLFGLLPLTRFYPTPDGEAERRRLEYAMSEARGIPDWLDRDPAQAVAFAMAAGSAVLLIDELRPHYRALAEAMRAPDRVRMPVIPDLLDDREGGEPALIDGGAVDFDLGACDFASFENFDAFDPGFDAACGDAGNGSEGGSGGC